MSFSHADFAKRRPFLIHTLRLENLPALLSSGQLFCAERLRTLAKVPAKPLQRRLSRVVLTLEFGHVVLQDQEPLHAGHFEWEGGWDLDRLLRELDARVFFWAAADSPGAYAKNHFRRYASEAVLIRVPSLTLFEVADSRPEFCRYNSGSPRSSNGHRVLRGPSTFVTCEDADFSPADVAEVTFRGEVRLPRSVEIAEDPGGPWELLWPESAGTKWS